MEIPPTQGSQLELSLPFESSGGNVSDARVSLTNNVSDSKTLALQRFCNKKERGNKIGSVNIYFSGGRNKGYFRFTYRDGRKTKHKHIPGGHSGSRLAIARAKMIEDMIARGAHIPAILKVIEQLSKPEAKV